MRRVQQNEITKSSAREIDAEKVELVTKADTEKKVARILELIKNESQSRKRGAKNSKRDSELVGLVEDFLRQYQSLYAQYDNLMRKRDKNDTRRSRRDNSPSTSSSDSEYFSSEDVDNNSGELRHDQLAAKTVPRKLEDDNKEMIILRNHLASIRKERETLSTEHMAALSKIKEAENVINDLRVEVSERKRELSTLSKKHQVLEVEASLRTKELEGQIGGLKSELQSLRCHKSDLEVENVIKDLRLEVSERKRELSTLSKKHQVLEVEASRRTKELEGQIGGLKSELQSLHCHDSDLEAEIQSQASEAKQLKLENEELQARIMELELISESKEIEMSDLLKKLDNNENSAKSRFAELEEQVRNLQMEARSLHVEKCTMEETVQRLQNKLLANEKDLDQINTLNEEVKLLESQIAKFQEREAVIEQNLIQIRTLEEELASTFEEKERVSEENSCLAVQVKDMKLKMDAVSARENDLLEQIRNHVHETNQCREEKEELEARFVELESKSIERGNELSALQEKLKADGDAYSSHISALTVRAKKLQEDVNSLLALKRQLELHNEKDRQESSPRFNVVLKDSKSSEQEVITPRRMARKYRQARSSLQEPMDAQFLERRMEELADEFRMHFEDNVRLMSQRILVLEQLHMENKDSYKMMKERFQREHGALKDRSYIFKAEMGKITDASRMVSNALHRLDLIVSKFGEQNGNVLSRMSKVSKEIQCLRNKVSGTKDKVRRVTSDAILQISAVDTKAMKNVVLNEESWALMAKVDDEGMEKMLMMKAVDRLEKRVAELENIAKVREEVLFGLVDEKKEAIRQLCLSINYYRDRCLQYREYNQTLNPVAPPHQSQTATSDAAGNKRKKKAREPAHRTWRPPALSVASPFYHETRDKTGGRQRANISRDRPTPSPRATESQNNGRGPAVPASERPARPAPARVCRPSWRSVAQPQLTAESGVGSEVAPRKLPKIPSSSGPPLPPSKKRKHFRAPTKTALSLVPSSSSVKFIAASPTPTPTSTSTSTSPLCAARDRREARRRSASRRISSSSTSEIQALLSTGLVRRPQSARIESVEAARGRLTRLKEIESVVVDKMVCGNAPL
ncbi:hypothetical protein NL676_010063 [Syzygium grande]|nr:hypothetical protein NL676_010063 [Syzygium grande]